MPIVEVSPTSRAKCILCSGIIARGELRVPRSERGYMGYTSSTYVHLMCYKTKPPTSVTAFIGHAELPEEQKIILQNFVDSVNKSYVPKKRAAQDNGIDDRKTKRLKSAIYADESLFHTTTANVATLPIEIITMIFKRLSPKDVAASIQVCKLWLLFGENEDLWREYCQLRCGDLPKDEDSTWKEHFECLLKKSCVGCGALTSSSYYFNPLSARLCLTCRTHDEFKLIKKTDLKDRFRLTDQDLAENGLKPQYITCNGTRAHFYLRSQVEQAAAKKLRLKQTVKKGKK